MKPLRIAYIYPAEMNIYGDRGNVISLQQRCGWRGIKTEVDEVHIGNDYDFAQADIVFGGGGQDKGQELVAEDLLRRKADLHKAMTDGVPMLVVCGLYQLFGRGFKTAEGKQLEGIGLFDAETVAGPDRLIGNVVADSRFGRLVGFENHSGQTKLDQGQAFLAEIKVGAGNDGHSGQEGAIKYNLIGTYLHGPILPKNPALADHLIETALKRSSQTDQLAPLNDSLEQQAARAASKLAR